jgi:hypothetical protein
MIIIGLHMLQHVGDTDAKAAARVLYADASYTSASLLCNGHFKDCVKRLFEQIAIQAVCLRILDYTPCQMHEQA